ncbi:hypothetical protein D3C80_1900630 [compost metagenome]
MRDDLHGHGHADIAHARHLPHRSNHQLADRIELALRGVAEFDFQRDIAAVDADVPGRAGGHQVLARIGVDDGAQGFGDLLSADAQDILRCW